MGNLLSHATSYINGLTRRVNSGEITGFEALELLDESKVVEEGFRPVYAASDNPHDARRDILVWDTSLGDRRVLYEQEISGNDSPFYAAARSRLLGVASVSGVRQGEWREQSQQFVVTPEVGEAIKNSNPSYVIVYGREGFEPDPN